MIFVIDTNIIFSALVKEGRTRELLIDFPFDLYAPEITISEIRKYKEIILQKSKLTKDEFETLFDFIIDNITIVKKEDYGEYMNEANKIIGHIDTGDSPFIALALSMHHDGIWSDDRHFKQQEKIKIWKTEDILNIIEKMNIF